MLCTIPACQWKMPKNAKNVQKKPKNTKKPKKRQKRHQKTIKTPKKFLKCKKMSWYTKLPMYVWYLYSLPLMKISLAIHFPLCLSRYFRLFFLTLDEFLDIFDIFFYPKKIRQKYLDKHSGKWIARLKFITAQCTPI